MIVNAKKKTVLSFKNMNEICHMMEDKRNNQNVCITANIVYIYVGSLKRNLNSLLRYLFLPPAESKV
jgi:hypothetical protein